MKLTLILLAFAWLAILDITLAMYDPFAVVVTKKHHYEHGGGKAKAYSSGKKGKKYTSQKGHKKKSKASDKGSSSDGSSSYGLHKSDDYDSGGKRSKYFGDDFFKDFGYEHGGSSHSGNYKKGGKKKNRKFSRGFREKYNKDEQTKSSSFYSNRNKGGDYKIFGEEFSKSGKEKGDKYSGGTKHGSHEEDHWGKIRNKAKHHDISEDSGYNKKDGKETDYVSGKTYKKKSGKAAGGKGKSKNKEKYFIH